MKHLLRISLLSVLAISALVIYDRLRPMPTPPLPPLTQQVDRVLIEKSARRLTVFRAGEALRSYKIALGFAPDGDKTVQGDGKTPEGVFKVNRRNSSSKYHLSLGLNYPQPADISRARATGINPGGDIFIHGQPKGFGRLATLPYDWTAGCIAVSDHQIEELWRVVAMGTIVEIRP